MKLKGYKNIEGIIEVVTGLHIGGSTSIIEIGGKDNPVIRHPITKEPYIPGSSLKGKMRSLLEWQLGFVDARQKVNGENNKAFGDVHKYGGLKCDKEQCPICVIFGTSADEAGLGPTRLIIRDAMLCDEFKKEQKQKDEAWTVLDLTEDKFENTINRITARANPRNFERVVSGVKFRLNMSYRVFGNGTGNEGQNLDERLFNHVIDGLKLIEKDALGGAGSRGCGQVSFKIKVSENNYKDVSSITVNEIPTLFPTETGEV
ncbi:MAG: type III-A CRISPR-associated RAMP protein Csm3 [Smithella sp.]|jgi:CRISPR-associated protein Csm3